MFIARRLHRSTSRLRRPTSAALFSSSARRKFLALSYVEGPKDPPLVNSTLSNYFERELLPRYASEPALICRQERPRAHAGPSLRNLGREDCLAWSFDEFYRHIQSLARGLVALGVKKGDRVGVVMGNNSAYATLQWACASIGAILVTVNPAYRTHELIETLKIVGVSTLVVVPRIRSSTYVTSLADAIPVLRSTKPGDIQVEELPELRNLVVVDNTSGSGEFSKVLNETKSVVDFRELFVWNESSREQAILKDAATSLKSDEVINLQFTSGTTGAPKAVSLTHINLLNNALSIGRCMRLTSRDILCNVPPLFHCFDKFFIFDPLVIKISDLTTRLVLGNLAAWSHGATIVYASEIFNPPAIVDAVVEERCTALHGVPTHFLGVLSEVDKRKAEGQTLDFSRLRTGIAAGSPIPIELMQRLISQINLRELTNAYGMTETSPVSFQTVPEDSITNRTETVGRVHPHVTAKLLDPEGNIVPVGMPGEICVSGYLVQKGYWQDEKQTRSVMKTHPDDPEKIWMHTGDVGILDEEGYLRVVGRNKDIIIRGGENLFPVQIENRLTFHDSIHEAAAIAVPDTKYGEVVGAWIVRSPNTHISREDVRRWVAWGMNPQNAPAWVWFLGEEGAPPELPKTASGKVQKHILRSWAKDLVSRGVGRVRVL